MLFPSSCPIFAVRHEAEFHSKGGIFRDSVIYRNRLSQMLRSLHPSVNYLFLLDPCPCVCFPPPREVVPLYHRLLQCQLRTSNFLCSMPSLSTRFIFPTRPACLLISDVVSVILFKNVAIPTRKMLQGISWRSVCGQIAFRSVSHSQRQ